MRNFSTRSSQVAKSTQALPLGGGCRMRVPLSNEMVGVRAIGGLNCNPPLILGQSRCSCGAAALQLRAGWAKAQLRTFGLKPNYKPRRAKAQLRNFWAKAQLRNFWANGKFQNPCFFTRGSGPQRLRKLFRRA